MDALVSERGSPAPAAEAEPARRARPRRSRPERGDIPERSDVAVDVPVPRPPFFGSRVVTGIEVADVARYLNRRTLYRNQWQYAPKRQQSQEEHEAFLRAEVDPILDSLLEQTASEGILQPAVVYGYFPCASERDDLIVYREDGSEWVRFTFPRQHRGRYLCISDFFRPASSGERDVVAFHLVTMGGKVREVADELFRADRYADYLHMHGLGVEMTEALAELWHRRIREELGIAAEDGPAVEDLFGTTYRGARYSFGYPACPNLEDQKQIFELLDPGRIGVSLSEEFQLDPEQSTSAIVVHHPEARYFSVSRPAIIPDA